MKYVLKQLFFQTCEYLVGVCECVSVCIWPCAGLPLGIANKSVKRNPPGQKTRRKRIDCIASQSDAKVCLHISCLELSTLIRTLTHTLTHTYVNPFRWVVVIVCDVPLRHAPSSLENACICGTEDAHILDTQTESHVSDGLYNCGWWLRAETEAKRRACVSVCVFAPPQRTMRNILYVRIYRCNTFRHIVELSWVCLGFLSGGPNESPRVRWGEFKMHARQSTRVLGFDKTYIYIHTTIGVSRCQNACVLGADYCTSILCGNCCGFCRIIEWVNDDDEFGLISCKY